MPRLSRTFELCPHTLTAVSYAGCIFPGAFPPIAQVDIPVNERVWELVSHVDGVARVKLT